jgi:hypothetical protein
MSADDVIREQLLALLRGGNSHMSFDQAVADFPKEAINRKPPNVPYTPWQLLEHMRIAQWDVLEFIRNPDHESPAWPDEYWPARGLQADGGRWEGIIADFNADLRALQGLIQDPDTDLTAPIPHAKDYTVFREILVVADHNAYHIGEFAILRQVMGTWPSSHAIA